MIGAEAVGAGCEGLRGHARGVAHGRGPRVASGGSALADDLPYMSHPVSRRISTSAWSGIHNKKLARGNAAVVPVRRCLPSALCGILTFCAVHVPGPSGSASQAGPSSRLPTPSEETRGGDTNSPAGAGANTPLNGKNGGNILLECSNCKRQVSAPCLHRWAYVTLPWRAQVASNRYAQHLSECLGLGSSRRGATRNATSKSK